MSRSRKGGGMFVDARKGEEARASAQCMTDIGAVEFVVGGYYARSQRRMDCQGR